VVLATRFEELRAWQQARQLTERLYRLSKTSPIRRDLGMVDQLRRAAVSTMNNVAEGFDSSSPIEFRGFLHCAARSASEIQSALYACLDQQYVTEAEFRELYDSAECVRRMCRALHKRLAPRPRRSPPTDLIRDPSVTWARCASPPRAPHAPTPSRADALTRSRTHAPTRPRAHAPTR